MESVRDNSQNASEFQQRVRSLGETQAHKLVSSLFSSLCFHNFPGSELFEHIWFCSFAVEQVVSVLSVQKPLPQDDWELNWLRTICFRRLFETYKN